MQINLFTSEANHQVVKELTDKLPKGTKENVIARIAIAYSISKNVNLFSDTPENSKGKEYKDHTLFEEKYKDFYVALICQHYRIHKNNPDIPKLFKLHLDHGLMLLGKLFEDSKNYSIYDFLLEHVEKGIDALENNEISLDAVPNFNQNIKKDYYDDLIKLEVGIKLNSEEKIFIHPNDISKYNNCHIAVAGSTGSGKTQFALEILRQFSKNTFGKVNFVYLDFKGLKKGEENSEFLKPFFEETQAIYIDAPQKPFPLNPLTFIDNVNEKNKIMGINKFVDIIAKYGNIGKNKEQILKDATKEAFISKKNGEYPTIKDIYDNVIAIEGNKISTLRGIMQNLSEVEMFENKYDAFNNLLNKNYYFSLSGELPSPVRFTAIFLIINYIYNVFMNMDNTPINNNCVGIRYVLLIDEAHVLFKEKKSQDILEKILREIRSKGVSVILLSQGIEEFNQTTFDFSTMCEISFLLKIKDINNFKVINKFLGFSESDGNTAKKSLEKIEKGQAISNIKEFDLAKLFRIKQFWERK